MVAKLDTAFRPMIKELESFNARTERYASQKTALTVMRDGGLCETRVLELLADGVDDAANCALADRYVKTMLWAYGGYRIIVAGSRIVYKYLRDAYTDMGSRAFDADFMRVHFEEPFAVDYLPDVSQAPQTVRSSKPIGRHLDGCRIGFDAGGSDRKVSAVIDGKAVYSEEVIWHPKLHSDPNYQYQGILESMKTAASKMPRVDAIGVSSAGTFRNNRIRHSSLFIKVPRDVMDTKVKTLYLDIAKEMGDVPIEVANDGDVTALAGAMDMNAVCVLGIAMGTSEAGGYVDRQGNITGWLNELAFVPVDMNPDAMVDEWSGDYGCGVKYFSQDAVIKLAPAAGIELDETLTPAEKLKVVQKLMERDDPRAAAIYETIGVYFGYSIAWYAEFYDLEHVLVMGRVTSGKGGVIIIDTAKELLRTEYPGLYRKVRLSIPDESSRRVGQSVAAASLPEIR